MSGLFLFASICIASGGAGSGERDLVAVAQQYLWQDTTLNSVNNTEQYKRFCANTMDSIVGGGYDVIWVIDSTAFALRDSASVQVVVHKVGDFYLDGFVPADSLITLVVRFTPTRGKPRIIYPRIPFLLFPKNVMALVKQRGIKPEDISDFRSLQSLAK
jgi:hypothetical protein